jgi:hypothetical protein
MAMDIDELKALLPLYVGETLDPAQRKEVEEALAHSEELRKELRFWERARTALATRRAHATAGHLTPEQIVDRAMGRSTVGEVLSFDEHLQSCKECAEDYNRVRGSLDAREGATLPFFHRAMSMLKKLRLVYAIPAVIIVIAVVAITYEKTAKDIPPPGPTTVALPATVSAPVDETATLWLTYRPEVRSTSRRDIPTLSLGEGERLVRVFVVVPQNQLEGIQYRVSIASSGKKPHYLEQLLRRYASGGGHDSLQFIVPRSLFPPPGDTVFLTVAEILPPALRALSPEEYRFTVEVKAKR